MPIAIGAGLAMGAADRTVFEAMADSPAEADHLATQHAAAHEKRQEVMGKWKERHGG